MTRRSITLCAGASLLAFVATAPARAQSQTAAKPDAATPDVATTQEAQAETEGQTVVVTGTRLTNSNFTAPTPVQVLSARTIEQRAPTNIADAVNELPAFRITRSSKGSGRIADQQQGVQSLLDMRGLGPTRTLVLVNGKRHVGTNFQGTVDTSLIPVGLIQRVDVVTGGASAAYGSDAVAGVTNFVLKNHFEGITGTLQSSITRYGDGAEYAGNLAAGTSFADGRGHIIVGVDASKSEGVGNIYSRPYGATEPGLVSPGATGTAFSQFTSGVEIGNAAPGGLITNNFGTAAAPIYYAFDASGTPYVFNRGTIYGTAMTGSTANYGYNPNAGFNLQNPYDRQVAYGRAEFQVSDGFTVFAEANYGRSHMPRNKTSELTSTLTIQRTNPFVPAALLALIPATTTSFTLGRINTDLGGNTTWQTNQTKRFLGGAEGKIGKWNWDAYYQYGVTTQDFGSSGFASAALKKAVNNCSTATGFTATELSQIATYESFNNKPCVAFNPFGQRNSAAAINYVMQDQNQTTFLTQEVAAVNISGSPFALWAGDISLAVGAEYRRDYLRVRAEQPVNNIYAFGNYTNFGGSNVVKEAFAEVGIPLIRDQSFTKALDLNGAIRRTDYRNSGAVTTWKLGATWEPTSWLRFRVTRSRDIRAPNLNELYFVGGGTTAANTLNSIPNGTVGMNGTVNTGNGLRGDTTAQGVGNPALVPEIANTITAGGVFQLGGFRASVDWYRLELGGAIVRLNSAQTLAQCASGVQQACSAITFDTSASGIALIRNQSYNINSINIEGIDVEVSYRTKIGSIPGTFEFRALLNRAIDYTQVTLAGATQLAGTALASPRWTGNVTLGYDNGPFNLDLQFRGFSKTHYDPALFGPDETGYVAGASTSINQNDFAGRIYNNLSVGYRVNAHFQLFGVVNNLLDVKPPEYAIIAMTNGARSLNYDLLGREYKVGVRVKF
jgi:outer membrane receptor protein involved in Fe transport